MGQFARLLRQKVESFEELNEVVLGSRREIVQIERGKLQGEINHAMIGDLLIDTATFNLGVRSRGGSRKDRLCISMVAEASDRVVRSSYESRPGDVLLTQPGTEHQNRYYGGTSVIVVMPSAEDARSILATDGRTSDGFDRREHFKGTAETVASVIPRLRSLIGRLDTVTLTADAAEFWKRAILEAMTANMAAEAPSECDGPAPAALRIVRQVEEHLESRPRQAVHISEICGLLRVPRRTLHRAFHEALGIGPIAYFRYRRLCAAHSALRSGELTDLTISDLAMQNGFQNVGRFASYYHGLFGEYPSETRQKL